MKSVYKNFEIFLFFIESDLSNISNLANYFRSENFETLKRKNIHNLLSLSTNCWYKNTFLDFIINILVFRIFLFVFGTLFLSLEKFEILVLKIISHMAYYFRNKNFKILIRKNIYSN